MRRRLVFLALALLGLGAAFVPLGAARAQDLPGDITAEATGPGGAVVSYDAGDLNCAPASGSLFPLGPTTVSCTDTGGNDAGSFTVTVVDTTPPDVTVPGDISESTTDPSGTAVTFSASANDTVDGPITPSCNPASGSNFAVGTTQVTCSATDAHNNTGSASFNVTVTLNDTTPPVVTVPSDISTTTQSPTGAVVTFAASANDNIDGPITPTCSPASGANFPVGQTSVTCSATDAHGNTGSATFNITVTLVDTTDPVVTVPSDIVVPAVSAAGAPVTFSVSANDNLDGPLTPSCDHSSGSTFPIGQTTVTCTATDAHGNSGSGSFHVTVQDQVAPTLSGMPAPIHVEANSPAGSVVHFTSPTATDNIDGPIANVDCAPASGSTFPLGTTTVTCSATDSSGNTGTASFTVSVVDTTPPHLIPPGDRSVYATTPAGIYDADEAANAFLGGYSVSDLADPHPVVTNDAPNFFFVGVTVVTFTARDASGNTSTAHASLDVRPMPEPGTTPPPLPPPSDRTPPDDVTNVVVTSGDGVVTITWANPNAKDFDHVEISRSTTNVGSATQVVYSGNATSFRDKLVLNGVEYRYVIKAVDKSGNDSAGVVVVAFPKASGLLSPKAGARVKGAVKFKWRKVKGAKYYNLQAFFGGTRVFAATADAKVLSAWPTKPSFVLKKTWKYAGRKRTLKPGVYTWYVWPGFGPRSAAEYGELVGSRSFTVVR
jgi:HYR domain